MNAKTLKRLRGKIGKLRGKAVPSYKLENLAISLGRYQKRGGKHPSWANDLLPSRPPISIPHHGKPLLPLTAGNILDDLEQDIDELEEKLGD